MPEREICRDCYFAVPQSNEPDNSMFTCHRNPPPFPLVRSDDWCGEWDGLETERN